MIASLRIENFALIDEVHIQFTKGFTVITGETGSGKSTQISQYAIDCILNPKGIYTPLKERS
jgi:DNA repair protein RecN (Recombination protein N)